MKREQELPKDLYGPTMLAFTLSAVLLILMKTASGVDDAVVISAEGTIMGTSFASSFGTFRDVANCKQPLKNEFVWIVEHI